MNSIEKCTKVVLLTSMNYENTFLIWVELLGAASGQVYLNYTFLE